MDVQATPPRSPARAACSLHYRLQEIERRMLEPGSPWRQLDQQDEVIVNRMPSRRIRRHAKTERKKAKRDEGVL